MDWNLKISVLVSAAMMTIGSGLRCFPAMGIDVDDNTFTILCHIGAFLNGVAGIVIVAGPPAVSAVWFPPNQRTTATSIIQVCTDHDLMMIN